MVCGIKWTNEEKYYLKTIVKGHHYKEIAEMMSTKFNRGFTTEQIKGAVSRYNLNTGFTGHFPKGNIPHNKGMKGTWHKGCEKTWFQKGIVPVNHREVGSERITKDGYIEIKVAEPNKWKLKHRVVWEKENGAVPKGYALIFLDQNKQNVILSNLKLVKRSELLILNRDKLINSKKELTEVGINIAKVKAKVNEIKRKK